MKSEKITESAKRWYDDACGAAHAMELLGERWSIFVVRELMFGPRRFGELRSGLPGISANVLTQRLDGLEAAGVIRRRMLPPPASVQVYELTDWGYEAEPIFQTLGRWAARSPDHDPTLPISAASLMLSFRTMIDAGKAKGVKGLVGFRFGPDGFVATLYGGEIDIERGDPADADVVFDATPTIIGAAAYGGVPLAALEEQGALKIAGARPLAERFVTLFTLPAKASIQHPSSPRG